jgi:hypothetical protein
MTNDVSVTGVPHQAERDDEYRGVKIKKGTIMLACEW